MNEKESMNKNARACLASARDAFSLVSADIYFRASLL